MTFQIAVPATWKGHQVWEAEADTFEEAVELIRTGGGTFVSDDNEVTSFNLDKAKDIS